jgi:hypothetical protein
MCVLKKEQHVYLWAKGLEAKGVHKEIVHVFDGKCCRVKRFIVGWQMFP